MNGLALRSTWSCRHAETDLDAIDALLGAQNYRLAHWRVANDELNYRRFFTVDTLVGVRIEDDEVFAAVHNLVLRLVSDGSLDGLRVDHVDGLLDPEGYLEHLARAASDAYTVVEKVLSADETLCRRWPAAGTTGYDFCAQVTGLFVDPDHEAAFTQHYRAFSGDDRSYGDIVHGAELEVLATGLASEVHRLTSMLADICDSHRPQRDPTRRELRDAVVDLLAAFDVYRTYVTPVRRVDDEDRIRIDRAVTKASGRRADLDPGLFASSANCCSFNMPAVQRWSSRSRSNSFARRSWRRVSRTGRSIATTGCSHSMRSAGIPGHTARRRAPSTHSRRVSRRRGLQACSRSRPMTRSAVRTFGRVCARF